MVNTAKIKGRLAELSLTQKDVSVALKVAQPTANQKLNNIRALKLSEAETLMKLLKIDTENFSDYFFVH